MREMFFAATGGRPMTRMGFAFTDVVSGESVCYYRDGLEREWLATGAWSSFRVERTTMPASRRSSRGANGA